MLCEPLYLVRFCGDSVRWSTRRSQVMALSLGFRRSQSRQFSDLVRLYAVTLSYSNHSLPNRTPTIFSGLIVLHFYRSVLFYVSLSMSVCTQNCMNMALQHSAFMDSVFTARSSYASAVFWFWCRPAAAFLRKLCIVHWIHIWVLGPQA